MPKQSVVDTQTKIEIFALFAAAILLAATMSVIPVWIGVVISYVAYRKASDPQPSYRSIQAPGYSLSYVTILPGTLIGFIARKAEHPQYNTWTAQVGAA